MLHVTSIHPIFGTQFKTYPIVTERLLHDIWVQARDGMGIIILH